MVINNGPYKYSRIPSHTATGGDQPLQWHPVRFPWLLKQQFNFDYKVQSSLFPWQGPQ